MTSSTDHITPFFQPAEVEEKRIWDLLEEVADPEVPVLSVLDLGIVREVKAFADGNSWQAEIKITPTYSGCPAMDMIAMGIKMQLLSHGYTQVKIITVLSPAWTTDWMSDAGKMKLVQYGIAAPHKLNAGDSAPVTCPQCHSTHTILLSQFGSTACKALYQCQDCKEPFDYFKCH